METWQDRAKQRMKALNKTQDDLKVPLGVTTRGAVGHYLAGRREPTLDQMRALAKELECTLDWLLSGNSSISLETIPVPALAEIPVVGTTQAGPGVFWDETGFPAGYSDEYVAMPRPDKNTYALRVRGGSMGTRIREGEAIIVSPATTPLPDDEVVVKTRDAQVMVKKLAYWRDGELALDSIGDGYKRIVINESDLEFVHTVVGIVPSSRIKHR